MSHKHNKFPLALAWFIFGLSISFFNDALQKYLGSDLSPYQITFLRFAFGALFLLPIMLKQGKKAFNTSRPWLHISRSTLLFLGIAFWCFGLNAAPIALATSITFIIPLFVLILARIFLKEHLSKSRLFATFAGLVGVTIALAPTHITFNPMSLLLVFSTFLFATLDILNKKFVTKEPLVPTLFYTALITAAIAAIPAALTWTPLAITQFALLAALGIGANLIFFAILKAFQYVEASAIAPFRYFELILSASFGFLLFNEIPTLPLLIGSFIIIPTTLFLAKTEASGTTQEEKPATQNT